MVIGCFGAAVRGISSRRVDALWRPGRCLRATPSDCDAARGGHGAYTMLLITMNQRVMQDRPLGVGRPAALRVALRLARFRMPGCDCAGCDAMVLRLLDDSPARAGSTVPRFRARSMSRSPAMPRPPIREARLRRTSGLVSVAHEHQGGHTGRPDSPKVTSGGSAKELALAKPAASSRAVDG